MRAARPRLLPLAVALAAILSALADEALRICPSCGTEAPPEARFCSHCGAAVDGAPGSAPAAPAEDPATAAAPAAAASPLAAVADAAFASGSRLHASVAENPAAALASVRSALALADFGTPRPDSWRKDLLAREESLLSALSAAPAPCPVCHGAGTVAPAAAPAARGPASGANGIRATRIEDVAVSRDAPRSAASRPCPFCGGRGARVRARDRKELAGVLGLGRRDFARAARAAGWTDFRGIPVPPGFEDAADVRARAALLRAAAPARACAACAGLGTVPCAACHGFGAVECPNGDFHRGAPAAGARRGGGERVEDYSIPRPSAAGRDACPSCGGAVAAPRAVPCPACGGRGLAVCKACDGSGEAPSCRRCQGEGTAPCRTCRGTGRDRRTGDPCPDCAGEGVALCSACGGTGHGR